MAMTSGMDRAPATFAANSEASLVSSMARASRSRWARSNVSSSCLCASMSDSKRLAPIWKNSVVLAGLLRSTCAMAFILQVDAPCAWRARLEMSRRNACCPRASSWSRPVNSALFEEVGDFVARIEHAGLYSAPRDPDDLGDLLD